MKSVTHSTCLHMVQALAADFSLVLGIGLITLVSGMLGLWSLIGPCSSLNAGLSGVREIGFIGSVRRLHYLAPVKLELVLVLLLLHNGLIPKYILLLVFLTQLIAKLPQNSLNGFIHQSINCFVS